MALKCKELTTSTVCYTDGAGVKQSLVAHYEYRDNADGEVVIHKTRYTDAAGVPVVTSAGTVTAGACPVLAPNVAYEYLCDVSSAGVTTEFVRRAITSFSAAGVPSTVTADLQVDLLTAYVPTGTVGACNTDCDVVAPVGLVATWG